MKLEFEEAHKFFVDFFFGEHHFPSEIQPCGTGWKMTSTIPLSTYNYNHLTRLVVMAHDRAIRVQIAPSNVGRFKIMLHKRIRDIEADECRNIYNYHPTLEDAIRHIRSRETTLQDFSPTMELSNIRDSLDKLILTTPTGEERNSLCDIQLLICKFLSDKQKSANSNS